MALVDLERNPIYLGPSITTARRSRNFSGALINAVGLATQTVPLLIDTLIELNTTVYDVGGWFDNSTALLRTQLTVPNGVSFIRGFASFEYGPDSSFVLTDSVFLGFAVNGVTIFGFGRWNVPSKAFGRTRVSLVMPPRQVVPGDTLSIVVSTNAAAAAIPVDIFAAESTAFGAEAVVGG